MVSSRARRNGGFTMLEMIVSFAILMVAFTILLPQWNRLRSSQECSQAAQQLSADIRRGASEALKLESYVVLDVTSVGYSVAIVPVTSAGNYSFASSWPYGTLIKRVNFRSDFPRCTIGNGASTRVLLGPKGWPVAAGSEPASATSAGVGTSSGILQAADSKGQFYRFTCTPGGNLTTYTVKLYTNGRVFVDTP